CVHKAHGLGLGLALQVGVLARQRFQLRLSCLLQLGPKGGISMTKSTTEHPGEMNKDARGSYASVNGLNMYYEIHGTQVTGRPLGMLHGGLSTIETDFGKVLPTLAKTRQVIAIEQQAHGHTADIDRPL